MIWKLCSDGDEVNDRLYFDHLPAIENFYGKSDYINGFDLQKAVIKAFSLLRKVLKFLVKIHNGSQCKLLNPSKKKINSQKLQDYQIDFGFQLLKE